MKFSFPDHSKFKETTTQQCNTSIRKFSPFLNPMLLRLRREPSFVMEASITLEPNKLQDEEPEALTRTQRTINRLYPAKLTPQKTIASKHQRYQALLKNQLKKVIQSNQSINETIKQFGKFSLPKMPMSSGLSATTKSLPKNSFTATSSPRSSQRSSFPLMPQQIKRERRTKREESQVSQQRHALLQSVLQPVATYVAWMCESDTTVCQYVFKLVREQLIQLNNNFDWMLDHRDIKMQVNGLAYDRLPTIKKLYQSIQVCQQFSQLQEDKYATLTSFVTKPSQKLIYLLEAKLNKIAVYYRTLNYQLQMYGARPFKHNQL